MKLTRRPGERADRYRWRLRAMNVALAESKQPLAGAAPPPAKQLNGALRVGRAKAGALADAESCPHCGAPLAGDGTYVGKTGNASRLNCPHCSAPLAFDAGDDAAYDESGGDADALEELDDADGEGLNEADDDVGLRERNTVPSRNADGSPVCLSEFQVRLRREVRARLRRGYDED